MSKHTPGQWTAIGNQVFTGVHTDNPRVIVQAKGVSCGKKILEAKTNAVLIAAAPELLEALKGIEDFAQEQINDLGADIQEGGNASDAWRSELSRWNAVLSAIYKAEGRTE